MKTVRLTRFGGPDALEVVDVPTPVPAEGEILVRVRAAGINFFETLMLDDRYAVTPELPAAPGVEVAGVVEAHGAGVAEPRVGARVAVPLFATGRPYGGYAEYVAVDAGSAVPLPDDLAFEDAAALLVQGLTALHALRRSPPEGKAVLVTAAGGGVGTLLVQLARAAGAGMVIAAAGSQDKRDLARSLGADVAVDYTAPDWAGRVRAATGDAGVDVVYDFVGGGLTSACLDALAPGGELVFGALGRFEVAAAGLERAFARSQALRGFVLLALLDPARAGRDVADLFGRASRGELRVMRGGSYPLEHAAQAHQAVKDRRTSGKVVLVP
ncbi:quinone oxidoreductase family protein [Arenibaculum sp.]|jgi:NADPH2:quinone reductase|uniref:quinone oxidoreductase family protein n=1 Tax=Arenibaculum sp. TaxID=2865862 RepID=UPI002E10AE9D|nr:zinc-binding dehydrogenase [Arenibaculum sp.]